MFLEGIKDKLCLFGNVLDIYSHFILGDDILRK